MPHRQIYDETEQTNPNLGLFNLIGHSKSITSGWSGFAIKTLVVCNASTAVFGAAGWMLLMGPLGPALSFLGSAGVGMIGGLVHRWRTDTAEAKRAFENFPELMRHHLHKVDPQQLEGGMTFERWRKEMQRSPAKQGHAIAALYSAAATIERIRQEEEDLIAQRYVDRAAQQAEAGEEIMGRTGGASSV